MKLAAWLPDRILARGLRRMNPQQAQRPSVP